jgi:predicted ester cyclase
MSPIISPYDLASAHFGAMETGDAALAAQAISPDHLNHEAADHPIASARRGLPGFMATSAWLRLAFSDLHFEILELVADPDVTIAHVSMSGRQSGPFVVFPPDGRPVAFPPTGRSFSVRQCHVFHRANGVHTEHAAVRDDLGMMTQLGHLPPSPAVIVRMVRWSVAGGRARAVRTAVAVAREASLSVDDPKGAAV